MDLDRIAVAIIIIITRLGINAPTGLLCNTLSNRCLEIIIIF